MKRFIMLTLVVLTVVLFAGCGQEQKTVEIKLSHDLLENTPQHTGALAFKEMVEERSEGRITVNIFPAGQLGSDVEVTEMMQLGTVEAGLVPTAKLSGFDPRLQILDLPFLFESREIAYTVMDSEIKAALMEPLEEKNLKGVAFWESGFKHLTANFSITEPGNMVGKKVRVMESPLLIDQYKMIGANPTPIDFSETYNALQQGVVEMQENPLVSIANMKFYEVQDYLMLSEHGYLSYAFLFSGQFWDTLSPEDQQMIEDAAVEAAQIERQATVDQEKVYLDTIKAHGVEVVELTDAQKSTLQEAWLPLREQYRDLFGAELLKQIEDKIESLR